jgi:choloylglycine hydrolase
MFTEYQTADEKDDGKIIAAWDVPTYFLTQCKSVEEVKAAISKIKVVSQLWHVDTPFGSDVRVEFHYTFHDPSGASMVLEYIDGEPKIYDNELGVLTNSPNFEWQRTNLSNYIHLSTLGEASKQVADVQLTALGSGAGMLGLPGDYTPPSRFVRTTALCHTAEKTKPSKSHAEGLQSAFRLSNTISFPEGISGEVMGDHLYLGKTDFQMVADTSKKVMYFKHYDYPNWQSLDVCALAQDNEIPLILDPSKGPAIPSAETQFEPKE